MIRNLTLLLLTLTLSLPGAVYAMTSNLALPWNPDPSPPRSHDVTFYSERPSSFLFDHGEEIVILCQSWRRCLDLDWALCRNLVRTPVLTGRCPPQPGNVYRIAIPTRDLTPGFYDLRVKVHYSDAGAGEGMTTFGWKINDEPIVEYRPPDFDAFWDQAVADLRRIPLDLHVELQKTLRGDEIGKYNFEHAALPEHPDPAGEKYDQIEVYKVDFASYNGKRVYAYFCKPVGKGPFPGLLVLPGAGTGPRPAPVEHAAHGFAAMDLQVHNQPVDLDREKYPPYPEEDLSAPEKMVHYYVYLNSLQAVSALAACPGVDPERLACAGGSQGGRLSIVVPALDHRIKATVPALAHYAYLPWLHWTERMNKQKKSGAEGFTPRALRPTQRLVAESYFDIVNFAPLVRCPVLMNAGLIDPVSPPTGVFAVYRSLTCPKQIVPLPTCGHDLSFAFDREAFRWLEERLGVR
jgi:cephalosporin-C deacetylase-like acetyl esterase